MLKIYTDLKIKNKLKSDTTVECGLEEAKTREKVRHCGRHWGRPVQDDDTLLSANDV